MLSARLSALAQGRSGRAVRMVWQSRLLRNAIYLLGGNLIATGAGFAFWLLAARQAPPAAIGLASALSASAGWIITVCDLGLGTAVVQVAGQRPAERVRLINAATLAGWWASSLAVLLFMLGSSRWAVSLQAVYADRWLLLLFAAYTISNYLLTLHDATMLAYGRARFVFWRTLACNLPSLGLLLPLGWVLSPTATPLLALLLPNIVVSGLVGAWLLPRTLSGYRWFGHWDRDALRSLLGFGLPIHAINLLWGLTTHVLPLVGVALLAPSAMGYFAISWLLANGVLMIPRAVISALFVERVQRQGQTADVVRQATLLIAGLALPLVLSLWWGGHWILGWFGPAYQQVEVLRLLLLAVLPFTINSFWVINLRLARRHGPLLVSTGGLLAALLGWTLWLVPQLGVLGLAWGWLLGQTTLALGVLIVVLWIWTRR